VETRKILEDFFRCLEKSSNLRSAAAPLVRGENGGYLRNPPIARTVAKNTMDPDDRSTAEVERTNSRCLNADR